MSKQIDALKEAAKLRKNKMLQHVKSKLEEMQKNKVPINFEKVAEHACVSKVWLYQQEEISLLIKNVRDNKTRSLVPDERTLMEYKAKIKKLEEKVLELQARIAKQSNMLETVYSKLIDA